MARDQLIKFRGKRSQEEMGTIYGVSQQAWSKWEKGEAAPQPVKMKQMEIDSGIPMEELFHDLFNNYRLLNENQTG